MMETRWSLQSSKSMFSSPCYSPIPTRKEIEGNLDKSFSGHSYTYQESIFVSSAELKSATAYEVSGTPVDCVSLALSGVLFAWSKPLLVIVGLNKGPSCGNDMFSSSAVVGARQALISGVTSLSISLNCL
ncbi:putative 5'-nucleotidase [Helianthus anomalus]